MKAVGKLRKSAGKVPERPRKEGEMRNLNAKQLRFCEEYLVDLNATAAAKRAGYSLRTAYAIGDKLLKKVEVRAKVDELKSSRSIRTEISADRVLTELARLAFYDPKVIVDAGVKSPEAIADLPEDVRRAIIGWKWDGEGNFVLKLSDKRASLELLGKHLALFTEQVSGKVEHSGSVEVQHVLEFGDPADDFSDIPEG